MSTSPNKRLRTGSPPREGTTIASQSKPPARSGRQHNKDGPRAEALTNSSSPFMPMFQTFRAELDEHHDRRERVIKSSRDITATSKKMIFTLQRTPSLVSSLPTSIATDLTTKERAIAGLLNAVYPSDISGPNAWRYQRQISPGLQEYMEACVFRHYLETGTLLSFAQANTLVSRLSMKIDNDPVKEPESEPMPEANPHEPIPMDVDTKLSADSTEFDPTGVLLTPEDYLLGVFDAVGEMMRWGITNLALTRGNESSSQSLIQDLRSLRLSLESLRTHGSGFEWETNKKMDVMRTCVEKVENAVYGMVVRGSERPKGWVPSETDKRTGEVESY